ncbi:5-oxoprolinase subunit B family protein [Rhodococcus spongiicola]|uniref:Allophanate hydrolase subunit 1 n=1 Tax=Rhodococcus spongiicola TaxID=2487352 RepID=A0A3S3CVG7_9NOCA|nr:allophanate hydrolase subunit 1 [Rhodococcus spongiicola]RVW06627.1 allophanate hydrolase subunit 1 [Rhodococcus spongiicola]
MRVLDMGSRALLVEFDGLDETLAHYRGLVAERHSAVTDLVPAARTVLVQFHGARPDSIAAWVRSTAPVDAVDPSRIDHVEIPVHYDGPDLEEVGALTGLGVDGVISAHTGRTWTVAFVGFSPGFGYLIGGDTGLHVPRRSSPRMTVPVGAVGLAGEFSGIYPRSSPGGWQLIGTTTERMWDVGRDPPALLRPGVAVTFVAV